MYHKTQCDNFRIFPSLIILREINFGDSFDCLNLVKLVSMYQKVQKFIKVHIQRRASKCVKQQNLHF